MTHDTTGLHDRKPTFLLEKFFRGLTFDVISREKDGISRNSMEKGGYELLDISRNVGDGSFFFLNLDDNAEVCIFVPMYVY